MLLGLAAFADQNESCISQRPDHSNIEDNGMICSSDDIVWSKAGSFVAEVECQHGDIVCVVVTGKHLVVKPV